nr:hypothetical protein [Luteibacter rhizovicinus]
MKDTIEMLEAIGSNATLRYASAVELAIFLERAQATNALSAAVASGDAAHLERELGDRMMFVPQATQTFLSSDLN